MLKGLPAYAWDHDKVYWKEGRISRNHRLRKDVPHELLGRRTADDSDYELRWRNVLRLTEIPWIRGHKFQGQVLFPAAGYVTMALEASKALVGDRHVRLFELRDICIRKALVLEEDQSSLETVFSVKRLNADFGIHDENMDLLEAEFSCYVCADETVGTLEKTVSGRIIIHLGSGVDVKLPPAAHFCTDLSPVDLDRFYSTVEELGLSYQGLFKGLDHAERMLNHSHALAVWENHSMGAGSMVHPALLDVMFQAIFVASISPAAPSTLWTPYLPVSIDRIIVDPDHIPVYSHPEVRAHIQAYVTKSSASSIVGDIHLLDSNGIHNGIQVEGLSLKSVAEPTEENDRSIFSQTVWDTDIASGTDFLRDRKEDAQESKLIHAIERVALFHFRSLVEAITVEKAKTLAWHHQLFLKAVKANIETIRTGGNPVVRQEWLCDTRETIEDLRAQHPGQIDLNLMHAVSEKLISIVCGETQILEVMLQDDMLNDFYMRGRGFETMNNCIARAVQQIAHKHPRAKYLEIGAGTGGTTHRILDTIESAYTSYEYTDISSAFFEKASHKFDKHASKMVFKVLDIEKDVVDQGFENGAYDVVIAANVLHATRTLSGTMGHIRSLLKPGGYLIFMEVTGDQLRLLFLFGALPGWWLGAGEGRSLGPGVSTIAWDNILRNTGFSGVDDVFYDFPDRSRHTCSVMISQAVDDQLRLLRDPLAATGMPISEQVLIIGGDTSSVSQLAYDTKRLISPWASCVAINNIDGLDSLLAKPLVMAEKSMLWTTEPELVFDGDDILIPRVLPDKEMNNRFNAARRPISENLWKESTCIELSNADNSSAPALFEIKNTIRPGETTIDVKYSCPELSPRLPVTVKPLEPKGLFLPDKTYLMIGMTGDLGRSLCRWMAEHGARYVVLTSRNAEVDSAWIESMAAIGATVKVYKMDVSNRKSVLGVYTTIKNSLPTIAGVCNAAMVLEDRLFANMTVGALSKVFEPKVEGSKVLDEIFHELNLDFFILFSSLTSILGNGGQSNYHAANLFMTSMCAQRRARGLAASVMHIGMVADIGYVARSDRHIENHLRKLQYHPMSETDMHYLFAEAVMSSRADHPGNWNIVSGIETFVDAPGVKLRPPHYHNPRFAHYVREENARKEDLRTDKTEKSVKELLEDAISEEDVTTVFQQAFLIKLERLTQLESHRIDANKSLLNLGVDSLSAVEIRNWFLQTVGVDIPVLKLLRGDTVSEISIDATKKYLAQRTS
ncbi:putative secondary metabolism biosynthetic enzyme [Alternaria postmessia]|uniref:putative secondary metabolism biosynthetic enzyme n=1 Tax=Alternaria postmessia TaxID=1187938 RepID=UPI0022241584|nr:putative secondary metabolism biosynthetic enzyme [Alternaria postmessia]KAI5364416.1 putative secondary metabolism biosynthetic enzyme [Alternaria postmessia]